MDSNRFDAISRLLADRLSRRDALRRGGAAIAGTAAAGITLRAAAQETAATPSATIPPGVTPVAYDEIAEDVPYLFVQTASGGSFRSNPDAGTPSADGSSTPGGGADYLLTLEGHPGGTIYFSDRPERIFGDAPTRQFLDELGFSPADPPNAALVVQTTSGEEDVVILELIEPVYDEPAGTITYGVNVLGAYEGEGLAPVAARQGDATVDETFNRASLFIDDCADHVGYCFRDSDDAMVGDIGKQGFCWGGLFKGCLPCREYSGICDETYPACNGECTAMFSTV